MTALTSNFQKSSIKLSWNEIAVAEVEKFEQDHISKIPHIYDCFSKNIKTNMEGRVANFSLMLRKVFTPLISSNEWLNQDELQQISPWNEAIIPSTFEELNGPQKEFLYANGGPETLWFLGQIPSLYRGTSKEVEDEAEKLFTLEMEKGSDTILRDIYDPTTQTYKILRTKREEEVIKCVREDCQDRDTILVVYGNSHDFSSVCNENGFLLEKIDTES